MCSACEKRFPLPEQVAQKVMPRAAKSSSKAIQRNIVLNQRGPGTNFEKMESASEPIQPQQDIEELQKEKVERRRKLKKRSKRPVKVYFVWGLLWLVSVSVIIFVVSKFQDQFSGEQHNSLTIEERLVGEEREFYKREYPRISEQFRRFLTTQSSGQMAEFTYGSPQLERKITRHLKGHARRRPVNGLKSNPVYWNVAFEESPGFVEVVWDGRQAGFFEGVFVKVDDDWKLDWEQYARYSSENWTLFRQRIGNSRSGLFRVYVEKISEGESSNFNPWIKVRLLPPFPDSRRMELEATEPILLEGGEEMTSQIARLFADRSGQSAGYSEFWRRDNPKFRRAFLRLEWETNAVSGEEKLVIKELLAEHWRSLKSDPVTDSEQEKEQSEDE